MGASSNDNEEFAAINVTPFVDVMLVLLVIFMVTTTTIVNRTIPVKLPKAASTEDRVQAKNLAFAIDVDNNLFLDGKPLDWNDVSSALEATAAQTQRVALISADTKTPHGSVIRLIDAVRTAGIVDFAINVEQLPKAP